jgi:ornithine--oxo-acid transaminase
MGVLCRDIHGRTIRIAPPLVTSREDLAWLAAQLRAALSN